MKKRTLTRGLAALLMGVAIALPVSAQDYPTRPIRIIVPVLQGGAMDISTRLVAQTMSEKLGQAIIVENRPGEDTVFQAIGAGKFAVGRP